MARRTRGYMSFWDDLNDVLAGGKPANKDPLARMQDVVASANLNLSGVLPSSSDPLSAPPSAPHQINIADAISSQQSRSQGFQCWDVCPQQLTNTSFPFLLTQNQMNDVTGYED